MSVESMVQGMIDALTEAMGDAAKHDKGNAAAGTRVRKAMQAAKATAQDVRAKVQALQQFNMREKDSALIFNLCMKQCKMQVEKKVGGP